MMKYAIPTAKKYFLPSEQYNLRQFQQMVYTRIYQEGDNLNSDSNHPSVSNPIYEHFNAPRDIRSDNDSGMLIIDKNPTICDDHLLETVNNYPPFNNISRQNGGEIPVEISCFEKPSTADVPLLMADAVKPSSEGNNSKEEETKIFKHLFVDLQLVVAYSIIIYILVTTPSSVSDSEISKLYADNISGKLYFSMVLTACVALMLDPVVDASLNFSEPIPKGKVLHRYRSRDDGIISLFVRCCIIAASSSSEDVRVVVDDATIPSEYEKADFSTFEQLLCCEKKTVREEINTATSASSGGDNDYCEHAEYKCLEILYCADQIMRWFYVPYVVRLCIAVCLMMLMRLMRCACCSIWLELWLRLSRFLYICARHHAENNFITKQVLFIVPLMPGLATHILLGWFAFAYVFVAILLVCFVVKIMLDKLVQYTTTAAGVISTQGGALDTSKIWRRSAAEQLRYVALKCMWRTFFLISAQVSFNYATLLYAGQPYNQVIGEELTLRSTSCFFHHIEKNYLVFFNWI